MSHARSDLRSLKNGFFLLGPYPLAASQLALGWFALPAKNTPRVELVQRRTERSSGLRNVYFWPPWTSKSIWCLWGWSCVGSMLQWSNFASIGVFCWGFVPPVPSEDQPHHPNSGGWHISTFLELKQWQYGWFNRENCKSSLIEDFRRLWGVGESKRQLRRRCLKLVDFIFEK